MTIGIKNILEIIGLGMAVGNGVFLSLKDDGKITFNDLGKFTPAMMMIPEAFAGLGEIPAELKDIDAAELNEIKLAILNSFPDVGDKWFVIAQESLNIGLSVMKIVNTLKV